MKEISLKAFLHHFCKDIRAEKKFCFILGAGASRPSGIPTGSELVQRWLAELQDMYELDEFERWKLEAKISQDDPAADYAKIYDKRFELCEKDGYAFLEELMEGKEPSCGYSILAQIIATKEHKIVITTNFDSLTEDALFIYTQKKPLVIGHEALAGYIKPFGTRPVIVKIHRDLYYSPQNTGIDTNKLSMNFTKNLTNIFQYYTPLVIGYGGNDGSLMGFLEELEKIEGGIFWFYRKTDGELSPRIQALIEKHNGRAIPIQGFDELMVQIGDKLKLERLDQKIIDIAKRRAENYQEQIKKVTEKKSIDPYIKEALAGIVSRGEKNWLYYYMAASQEEDMDKRETIYKTGIEKLPNSPELLGNYAIFLKNIRKAHDQAELYYQKALAAEPDKAANLSNYAIFLTEIRKDLDQAEQYYQKALAAEPDNADILGNYANFLTNVRKNHDQAEQYYKKALATEPDKAIILNNYAAFLTNIRKAHDQAEQYYQKALTAEPDNADILGNYAIFLTDIRKAHDQAEQYYQKALAVEPNKANNLNNYAIFLTNIRKDHDQAEQYYIKAFAAEPDNAKILSNYANFLTDIGKDHDQAEQYYQKALAAEPDNANILGNYAKFLIEDKDFTQASVYINHTFENNSKGIQNNGLELELWFYRYAVFFKEYNEASDRIEALLKQGVRSPGWNLKKVLEVAKELGHPDYQRLCRFEQQITETTSQD